MAGTSLSLLDAELRAAGLALSDADLQRLLPIWEDNLDRRSRLRSETFAFHEVPFANFLPQIATPIRQPLTERKERSTLAPAGGDPCDLTLAELAALLNARALSSAELTDAYLRRIARDDPVLRGFVTVDEDPARRAAARADSERAAGVVRGPLHGMPIAVKDMIAIAGLPMTAGSRLLANNVASTDADVVARLRIAGAVLLGTNSLIEFGTGPAVRDGPLATGLNPWNPTRIPGGSSSGSAVAVAAGFCAASLGTDSAGSVRMPASYTGLVGLKTTRGLVSLEGVMPFCWSLDTVGPLTRGVEDAALVMNEIAAFQPAGAFDQRLGFGLRGLRLGVLRRGFLDAPDVRDDVRAATETTLEVFRACGATLVDVELPSVIWNDVIYTTLLSEAYCLHARTLRANPDDYTDWVRTQLYAGALFTAEDVARARRLQGRLVREALAALEHVDAFVLPGQAEPAPEFPTNLRPALTQPRSRFTRPWSITGMPALALPCGFSREDLPLSIHLVGQPFHEPLLLQLGFAYQQETDWHRRRPEPALWVSRQNDVAEP